MPNRDEIGKFLREYRRSTTLDSCGCVLVLMVVLFGGFFGGTEVSTIVVFTALALGVAVIVVLIACHTNWDKHVEVIAVNIINQLSREHVLEKFNESLYLGSDTKSELALGCLNFISNLRTAGSREESESIYRSSKAFYAKASGNYETLCKKLNIRPYPESSIVRHRKKPFSTAAWLMLIAMLALALLNRFELVIVPAYNTWFTVCWLLMISLLAMVQIIGTSQNGINTEALARAMWRIQTPTDTGRTPAPPHNR